MPEQRKIAVQEKEERDECESIPRRPVVLDLGVESDEVFAEE